MSDELSADELAEIERKVARYREMVTKAAVRRAIKLKKRSPTHVERWRLRKLLDQPETQISLIERVLAGATYTNLAAEFMHSPSFLSGHLRRVVLSELEYQQSDYDCEWFRCNICGRDEIRATWMPLALQRLKARYR